MSEDKFDQVFQISSPARLVVSNIRGSTEIQTGEDGSIHVTAVKHGLSGDAERTEVEIVQEADGTVKATTRFPEMAWSWIFGARPCNVDYVIKAPRTSNLKVNGVSNDTLIAGFDGECSVNTVSGEVELRDLNGPLQVISVSGGLSLNALSGALKLHTVSGRIAGEKLSGSVHLDTVSGDIRLKESDFASAESESVSGNVVLQTRLAEGPYRFHSVSGEVRITLPAETRCSAELHSVSGRLATTLPQSYLTRQNGTQVIEVQGGGVKVVANSVSGGLSLES